jgi:hypothetical protein
MRCFEVALSSLEVKVIEKKPDVIVFATKGDLHKFYEDIQNGKTVLLTWTDGDCEVSELLTPNNSPQINDGSVKLMSKEIIKKK